jgi:chromosome segregation ATPase
MVNIEQVRLLEKRVTKAIDYVNKVTNENTLLKEEINQLRAGYEQTKAECTRLKEENVLLNNKLETCQKRIDELEVLIQRFKEDQVRIEEGIVSALNNLNRFEDDVEKNLTNSAPPLPDSTQAHTAQVLYETEGKTPIHTPDAPLRPPEAENKDTFFTDEVETFDDLSAAYSHKETTIPVDPVMEEMAKLNTSFAGNAPSGKELDIY